MIPYDVVVTDFRMPKMDGAQLLSYVAEIVAKDIEPFAIEVGFRQSNQS